MIKFKELCVKIWEELACCNPRKNLKVAGKTGCKCKDCTSDCILAIDEKEHDTEATDIEFSNGDIKVN